MIARCASRNDVIGALAIGKDRERPIAVRGAGPAEDDDGAVVVDLSALNAIELDPASRTVSVGPG